MAIFRNVALCNMVETDRRLRGAYRLHHQDAMFQKVAIVMFVAGRT